ncbi:RIP metalloprotease RseP [Sedimentimonas flavescens]|uniref:Zinc metalloprotease n=1 Tax=Sedimentimonas flavescens TaxID=2851012 RepID=A0ABT2ZXW7_9RHOB|nr:RIP metalloprotease RseP [Sedimentimonas flavescens]MCV2878584.1 RIP metalloprotease RseP [Sedimentimonas flavescens]
MDFLSSILGAGYTIASFVIALSIIVAVHEFGHYIVGRWSGIKAEVFSLGFGPKLISRVDKRGTRWQIAAIPMGGYVKFLGDANAASAGVDQEEIAQLSPEERRHTMHGAPLWARAATVAAGPIFNFILSIGVISGLMLWSGTATEQPTIGEVVALPQGTGALQTGDRLLAVEGIETPDYLSLDAASKSVPAREWLNYVVERDGAQLELSGPQLLPTRMAGVAAQSAAYEAGLEAGDVIETVNGAPVWQFRELQDAVKAADGAPLTIGIWRPAKDGQGTRFEVTLSPKRTDLPLPEGGFETRWLIGASGSFFFTPETRPTSITEALRGGATQTWGIISQSVSGLWHMVTGQISSCNLRGAIGIAEGSAAAAKSGMPDFIWFIALLSTAVGFLNLFPIPVLDGGHLVFHVWEAVAGKPPSDRVLNGLMAVGMALVLTLMLFGLSNDLFCP